MRRLVYFAVCCIGLVNVQAQLGFSGHHLTGTGNRWQYEPSSSAETAVALPGEGWQASVDYGLSLNGVRIDFMPTLAYSYQNTPISVEAIPLEGTMHAYHFFLNTNIYFLDIQGDCGCPTFSKEGPMLQKGLFVQLSPGVTHSRFIVDDIAIRVQDRSSDTAFSFGAGFGVDIGLSEALTLTPNVNWRYYPSITWSDLSENEELPLPEGLFNAESTLLQRSIGLRVGVRLD